MEPLEAKYVLILETDIIGIMVREGAHYSVVKVAEDELNSYELILENDEFIYLFSYKED